MQFEIRWHAKNPVDKAAWLRTGACTRQPPGVHFIQRSWLLSSGVATRFLVFRLSPSAGWSRSDTTGQYIADDVPGCCLLGSSIFGGSIYWGLRYNLCVLPSWAPPCWNQRSRGAGARLSPRLKGSYHIDLSSFLTFRPLGRSAAVSQVRSQTRCCWVLFRGVHERASLSPSSFDSVIWAAACAGGSGGVFHRLHFFCGPFSVVVVAVLIAILVGCLL
jgi:hypothetical protein